MPELERQAARIDSHQHFWATARKAHGWLEALQGEGEAARRRQRPILTAELAPQLAAAAFHRTVLVQEHGLAPLGLAAAERARLLGGSAAELYRLAWGGARRLYLHPQSERAA
jgi:predicted TIM-barrel fold metal-dependent hydrolase